MIGGSLTIANAPEIYAQGLQLVTQANYCVNFSQVEGVDSSAVSIVLAWQRAAQNANKILTLSHLPNSLSSLAELYGVLEFLPAVSV
jgi:phospholipid transport system transporter-binding protein